MTVSADHIKRAIPIVGRGQEVNRIFSELDRFGRDPQRAMVADEFGPFFTQIAFEHLGPLGVQEDSDSGTIVEIGVRSDNRDIIDQVPP